MLEIKSIKSYKLPKYPQGLYYGPPENYPWNLLSTGIASAALLALLGCSGSNVDVVTPPPNGGVVQPPPSGGDVQPPPSGGDVQPPTGGIVGPPPMPPDYVTEREARTIVDQAFARYGITFDEDVPKSFSVEGQPFTVNLDGFNQELNIGYEYESTLDGYQLFFDEIGPGSWIAGTATNRSDSSILVIENVPDGTSGNGYIEKVVEKFVHELQSNGIL